MAAYDPNRKKYLWWAIQINVQGFEKGIGPCVLGKHIKKYCAGAQINLVQLAKDLDCKFLTHEQEQAILLALISRYCYFSNEIAADVIGTTLEDVACFLQMIQDEIGYYGEEST